MINKNDPDYVCKKDGGYHDYDNIIADTPKVQVEQCVRCGHKISFNKKEGGRIDNKRYLNTHALWFLQPSDPDYRKYYGKFIPPRVAKTKGMSREELVAHYEEELNQGLIKDHGNRKHFIMKK